LADTFVLDQAVTGGARQPSMQATVPFVILILGTLIDLRSPAIRCADLHRRHASTYFVHFFRKAGGAVQRFARARSPR
jgi:hypothetical protein